LCTKTPPAMPCETRTPSWGSAGEVPSAFPRSAGPAFEAASWGISSPPGTGLDVSPRFAARADRGDRRTRRFPGREDGRMMSAVEATPGVALAASREAAGEATTDRLAVDATLDRYHAL